MPVNPSRIVKCAGCGRFFTPNGYTNHLIQTRNEFCQAITQESERYLPNRGHGQSHPPGPQSHTSAINTMQKFTVDIFGGNHEEFDFLPPESILPEDVADAMEIDGNQEGSEISFGIDTGGRNIRRNGRGDEDDGDDRADGDDGDDSDNSDDEDDTFAYDPLHTTNPATYVRGYHTETTPQPLPDAPTSNGPISALHGSCVMVPFDGLAGVPISSSREQASSNTYEKYQKDVGGSDENPYAPFTSELEWQVARWAKLRGKGMTAISELLSINGVCA
jgi:hypothetical protein